MKQYGEAAQMDMQLRALTTYFEQLPAIAKAAGEACNRLLSEDYAAMGAAALEAVRPYTVENMVKAHVDIFT